MLVFDGSSQPLILDDINTPTIADHIWVLDLVNLDFTIVPLNVLEEIISPSIEVMIDGFMFVLPAIWNILVVDQETLQLDVVEVSELSGRDFFAFVYGPDASRFELAHIRVTAYHPNYINVGPFLNKNQMVCHPISPEHWVNVAPSDTYNKYLKNRVAGDLT